MKRSQIFIFSLILALATFLRLFMLGTVPAGLTNDEANTGYDSYSLLTTGHDQWNKSFPILFRGFGDYPPPLYRYLAIPSIKVFGLNSFATRFPSAIFGILSVAVIFFLARKLFNENTGLLASFLFAVNPWSVALSRVAIESNVAVFFLLLALLLFLKSKNTISYILSIIAFALTLYTYAAYSIFTPLVVLTLIVFHVARKNLSFGKAFIYFVLFLLFISLLFLQKSSSQTRFSQIGIFTNINNIGILNTLNDQRGACLKYIPSVVCKTLDNKTITFSEEFVKNYLNHFSFNFLFLSGTETQFSILPQMGLDYIFGAILLLIGFLAIFKVKISQRLFLLFFLLSPIPDSLTGGGNYSRAFIMLPFLMIVESVGANLILEKINLIKNSFISNATKSLIVIFMFFALSFMFVNYFTYFRDYYSRFSQYGYQQLMEFVKSQQNSYDKIYISYHINDTKQYMFYLFFTGYNPKLFQTKQNVSYHLESNGWVAIDRINNIYFVPNIESKMIMPGNLLISHPSDFNKCKVILSVKDRVGYEMFEAIPAESYSSCLKSGLNTRINNL